jgi:neutral ceramidase
MEEDEPVYSADYPGVLVVELEVSHGGVFGFLLGASGDTAPPDPASPDPHHGLGKAHMLAMGRALAERADEAIRTGRVVDAQRVGVAATRLQIAQRRPTPQQVELARWYLEERSADIDEAEFTRRISGHDYTFGSEPASNERFVRDLLGMWEWQRRAGSRELVEEIEVQVVVLGELAIVGLPVELFTAFGRRLKADSPFADTFIATLANGWHGYAPTPEAFVRGGYEPRLAYASRLVPEAGDLITDAALGLLRRLAALRPSAP